MLQVVRMQENLRERLLVSLAFSSAQSDSLLVIESSVKNAILSGLEYNNMQLSSIRSPAFELGSSGDLVILSGSIQGLTGLTVTVFDDDEPVTAST